MTNKTNASPDDARAEIDRLPLDADMMAALQDPAHPGHKAASAHRNDLYARAYGDAVVDGGESAFEDSFLSEPTAPEDYRFDPVPPSLQHDADLERQARGWFHEAGAPHWLARNVAREWNRALENPPDDARQAADAAATEKSLRRLWGDEYDGKIAAARSVVQALKNDDALALLDRSGLANSEYLIRQLAALAEHRGQNSDAA
ncbi:MAG: hypothetical protein AAF942_07645 [Pseudomonadota bacterium]